MQRDYFSRTQLLVVAGHIIECFDNTLYGFFAVILAPLFFPSYSENAAILSSYGAFAAGFLARPFGALLFGYWGDTKGRKNTLVYSMALISIPTLIIGLLPTYETIGLAAPLILIFCRLIQGFLMGGEFTGANLYISENSSQAVGRGTGILISFGILGAVFATLVGGLVTLDIMPSWAWRLPFLGGGLAAIIIFFLRRSLSETQSFKDAQETKTITQYPWKLLLKNYKRSILIGCLISGLTIVPLYCATILGNKIFRELGYTSSECMLLNTFGMIVDAVFVLYFGTIADRVGFQRLMIIGTAAIFIAAIPAFYPFTTSPALGNIIWFIFVLVAVGCIINGCGMPYIAGYFPTHCRFSGTALSVTLGHALLGGTTPIVGAFLTDFFHSNMAPAYWIMSLSFITLGLLLFTPKPAYLDN